MERDMTLRCDVDQMQRVLEDEAAAHPQLPA
jgi:hypothetical protein